MAAHLYEASFLATFPKLRARDAIVSELAKDLSGSGTDESRRSVGADHGQLRSGVTDGCKRFGGAVLKGGDEQHKGCTVPSALDGPTRANTHVPHGWPR